MMLNQVPGILGLKLTTPFDLVQNIKQDCKTWFEFFSIGYSNHHIDNTESRSKKQAGTLDEIVVGGYDKLNFIFLNPLTSSYYCPHYFCLDESRLPITNFPNYLQFDVGHTCSLLQNKSDPIREPLSPGTRV